MCFSKTDLFTEFPSLPGCSARFLSSQTGDGVAAWLDDVLGGRFRPGGKILEIDYERYARAEAALAWLNCSATVKPASPASPASVVGSLLDGLDAALTAKGFTIAHLKVMDESPARSMLPLCATVESPSCRGVWMPLRPWCTKSC